MKLKFWPQKQLQMLALKAEMFNGCLFRVLQPFEKLAIYLPVFDASARCD
jgi:hypothetical protein